MYENEDKYYDKSTRKRNDSETVDMGLMDILKFNSLPKKWFYHNTED